MHGIVLVLLANDVHGQAKFVAWLALVTVLMLANSMSTSCGTPMTMLYVAIRAALDCRSSMLNTDLLAKIEGVIDHLKELFQHVIC